MLKSLKLKIVKLFKKVKDVLFFWQKKDDNDVSQSNKKAVIKVKIKDKDDNKKGGKIYRGFVKVVIGFSFFLVTQVYIMVVSLYVIPVSISTFAGITQITYETPFIPLFALWIMPSVFWVALLIIFSVFVLKWMFAKTKWLIKKLCYRF